MADRYFWRSWPTSLRWAITISLAIHLLVIFPIGYTFYKPIAMPQAPLSAVLSGPGQVAHAAKIESKHPESVSAGDTARISRQQSRQLLQVRENSPKTQLAKTQMAVTGVAQGEEGMQPSVASRSGVLGGSPELERDGVEADALQRYRLALGLEARKARRYPEVSRVRGQEGTCELYVVLSRSGTQPTVVLGRSGGSSSLDEAALVMVRAAVERTAVPQELQGRNLRIPLRIRFSLDDF